MKTLLVTLSVVMMAFSFAWFAPATSSADTVDVADGTVFVTGWGRTYDEAEKKAKQKAENFAPYEIISTEFGWDPTHIPHNYQYFCELELELF